jgi:hypothetical protein
MDIKLINGNEILDYLNSQDLDVYFEKPYIFESQEISGDKYRLSFSVYFNNWGTDQLIGDNIITITNDCVTVSFDEPFDGDGSSEILEEIISEWLETHTFSDNNEQEFDSLLVSVDELLTKCKYGDSKSLTQMIDLLTKAKTYIK